MKKDVSAFAVAGIYIGTLIGAGFASGQEILQFFVFYGLWGIVGLIFATGLFIFFGYVIMELAFELKSKSHLEIICKVSGQWLGRFVDTIITFFLLAGFIVMAAGSGAIFNEQFNLSSWLGSGIMIIVSVLTIFMGVAGIIHSISILVPILLFSVLFVCFLAIFNNPISLSEIKYTRDVAGITGNWLLSSVLYVSYNIVVAVAVLAPLGELVKKKVILLKGAVIGGFSLGLSALAINLALLANLPEAAKYEVPMVLLASKLSPVFNYEYVIVLLLGIYTTAVGSLFGFLARTIGLENPRTKFYTSLIGFFALFASQLGFSTLVKIVYPAVGYAGLLLLAGLSYGKIRQSIIYGVALAKPLIKKGGKNE
ncbi:MAG: hypothetical protein PWQ67_2433 [Clostridia bacterium]|jgi:uncharacterized membrane protein YkvI|nr:hypothetical protein [Clostridia bacterium]